MSNGFDKIAKKAEPKGKKATKIAATVTKDVKTSVDEYISINAKIKGLESDLAIKGDAIITHVLPQQEEAARAGNFSKSFEVSGEKGVLTMTLSDSFSVPQDEESLAALKTLLKKKYDEYFSISRVASFNADVLKDDALTKKIIGALEKAGLSVGDIITVTDKVVTKDDIDRKQFDLSPEDLAVFRTLVKQKKASLK
jgi:hypothetical protein